MRKSHEPKEFHLKLHLEEALLGTFLSNRQKNARDRFKWLGREKKELGVGPLLINAIAFPRNTEQRHDLRVSGQRRIVDNTRAINAQAGRVDNLRCKVSVIPTYFCGPMHFTNVRRLLILMTYTKQTLTCRTSVPCQHVHSKDWRSGKPSIRGISTVPGDFTVPLRGFSEGGRTPWDDI